MLVKTTFDPKIGGGVHSVFNALKYLMNEESGQKDDKKVDTKADKIETYSGHSEPYTTSDSSV